MWVVITCVQRDSRYFLLSRYSSQFRLTMSIISDLSIGEDPLLGSNDFMYAAKGADDMDHWGTEQFEKHVRTLDAAGLASLTQNHFSFGCN